MILAELLHVIDKEQPISVIDVSNDEIYPGLDVLPISVMDRTVAHISYTEGFQIYVLGKDNFIEVYLDNGVTAQVWTDEGSLNYDLLYGKPTEIC